MARVPGGETRGGARFASLSWLGHAAEASSEPIASMGAFVWRPSTPTYRHLVMVVGVSTPDPPCLLGPLTLAHHDDMTVLGRTRKGSSGTFHEPSAEVCPPDVAVSGFLRGPAML